MQAIVAIYPGGKDHENRKDKARLPDNPGTEGLQYAM
jgi:hypothetical protein